MLWKNICAVDYFTKIILFVHYWLIIITLYFFILFYALNSYRAIMYVPTVNDVYNVAHVHFTTCCAMWNVLMLILF